MLKHYTSVPDSKHFVAYLKPPAASGGPGNCVLTRVFSIGVLVPIFLYKECGI